MVNETPQDVAALLSHTQLKNYKVFTQDRRSAGHDTSKPLRTPVPVRPAFELPAPEVSVSDISRPAQPRWSLLHNMATDKVSPAQYSDSNELHVPTFAVCSTVGGTGKTTVSTTLGRALSMTGDRILVIHGSQQPSVPLHFGVQFAQAGRLRTFVPPVRNQGTVHLLSHEFDGGSEQNEEGGTWLVREVNSVQCEVDRCIVEISSLRGQEGTMLNLASICLIVLTPDINSVMALTPFRKLAERVPRAGSQNPMGVYFLINKFDPTSAFHAEVRQNLRLQLGANLLPFCIRRDDTIAEALAAGMTVLDYAPTSAPAEDFLRLATWAREVSSSHRAQRA